MSLLQLKLQGLVVDHRATLENDGCPRGRTSQTQFRVVEGRLDGTKHLYDQVSERR